MDGVLFNDKGTEPLGLGYGLMVDMVVSIVAWTLLQVVFFYWPDLTTHNFKRNTELDFRNRMVSIVHGFIACNLCFYMVCTQEYVCG